MLEGSCVRVTTYLDFFSHLISMLYESTFRLLLINFQSFAFRTVFCNFCNAQFSFFFFFASYTSLSRVQAVLEITSCMGNFANFQRFPQAQVCSKRFQFETKIFLFWYQQKIYTHVEKSANKNRSTCRHERTRAKKIRAQERAVVWVYAHACSAGL